MKRRIADWLFNFWYNNHTHNWIVFTPCWREKCRHCGTLKKI